MSKITLIQELEKRLCKTSLTIVLIKNEDYWNAECPELELLATGDNFDEAMKKLITSINMFLVEGFKTGELKASLIKLGWNITKSKLEYNGLPKQSVELSKNEQVLKLEIEDILDAEKIDETDFLLLNPKNRAMFNKALSELNPTKNKIVNKSIEELETINDLVVI